MGLNLTAQLRARGRSSMRPGDSITEVRRPVQSNMLRFRLAHPAIKAVSVMNRREHWTKRQARTKEHREKAFNAFAPDPIPALPVKVMLVRVAPKPQDDDNLRASLKATRDGIADLYGVADNDPRIVWEYHDRKIRGKWFVGIRIERITVESYNGEGSKAK